MGWILISRQLKYRNYHLYLKLLENGGSESQGRLFRHSDLKLLPDLLNNIKCWNSLIGSDYYADKDMNLFVTEQLRKVNIMDWTKAFSECQNTNPNG